MNYQRYIIGVLPGASRDVPEGHAALTPQPGWIWAERYAQHQFVLADQMDLLSMNPVKYFIAPGIYLPRGAARSHHLEQLRAIALMEGSEALVARADRYLAEMRGA
ncbi:MAG: hypothetical protein RJA19_1215 [Bacteroidota bacterium]